MFTMTAQKIVCNVRHYRLLVKEQRTELQSLLIRDEYAFYPVKLSSTPMPVPDNLTVSIEITTNDEPKACLLPSFQGLVCTFWYKLFPGIWRGGVICG